MKLPTRKKNRLTEYDYSTPNAYFITICTDKRKKLFWTDADTIADRPENVPLSDLGAIVRQSIEDIPKHYPQVSVDHYVIMPNHVHLLLQIYADSSRQSVIAPTVSTVIRLMKGAASKEAGFPIWQKGFYDHVIRNDKDYREIWNYIDGNPGKWAQDPLLSGSPSPS